MLTLNNKVGAWILVLLAAFVGSAKSDDNTSTSNPNTEKKIADASDDSAPLVSAAHVSLLGNSYSPPKIEPRANKGTYPVDLARDGQEGWVVVNMMVDREGKPFEASVTDSSNSNFEKWALFRAKNFRFKPATLNGNPVDAAFSMKFMYRIAGASGASSKFIQNFKALEDALKKNEQSAAADALQAMKIKNLYEEAFYHLAHYLYAKRWGSEEEQLRELKQSIAYERTSKYLPKTYFRSALGEIFRLQVKANDYFGALDTAESFDEDMKQNPAIVESIAAIKKLSSSNEAFSVRGEIPKNSSWNFSLLKPNFSILLSEGEIEEIKLRCEAKYALVRYKPDFEYNIPQDYGRCSLELIGSPGAEFTLVQS